MPRSLDLPGRLRISRCFRTTPEGRIAVTDDWVKLLNAMTRLGPVALQTRHAYARMVAVTLVPQLSWCAQRRCAADAVRSLQFHFDHWQCAWARLAHCDCCGSPGRIEVCNEHGLDFLQVCALPECQVADWADFLADVTLEDSGKDDVVGIPFESGGFARAPAQAALVSNDVDQLVRLLTRLSEDEGSVSCTLVTEAVCHRREFSLNRVVAEDGVLTAGEGLSRFQLGLVASRRLAVTLREDGFHLHVVGADDALLLTLSGAAGASDNFLWKEALRAVFPAI